MMGSKQIQFLVQRDLTGLGWMGWLAIEHVPAWNSAVFCRKGFARARLLPGAQQHALRDNVIVIHAWTRLRRSEPLNL